MDKSEIRANIETLAAKKTDDMYLNDFLLTWDKSEDEIAATFLTAEILRANYAFRAVAVPAGEHQKPSKWLTAGICLRISGML